MRKGSTDAQQDWGHGQVKASKHHLSTSPLSPTLHHTLWPLFSYCAHRLTSQLPSPLPTRLINVLTFHPFPRALQDLARLSLSDPEYLAVHSDAQQATPLKLQQAYAVVRRGALRWSALDLGDGMPSFMRRSPSCCS